MRQSGQCARCGQEWQELDDAPSNGRLRKWCSGKCRRLASEERRAAARAAAVKSASDDGDSVDHRPVQLRPTVEPLTRDTALRRIIDDTDGVTLLLKTLIEMNRQAVVEENWNKRSYARLRIREHRPVVKDLLASYDAVIAETGLEPFDPPPDFAPPWWAREAIAAAEPPPPAAPVAAPRAREQTTPQEAVNVVLSSPRATRQLLDELAAMAAGGELLAGPHSGTVNAAQRLLQALVDSRTLRPR